MKDFNNYRKTIFYVAIVFALLSAAIAFSYYFSARLAADNGQVAAWVQAVGSVIAIVIAIIIALFQHDQAQIVILEHERDGAKATYELARESLIMVGDRLNAALEPHKPRSSHALRGFRTTEMVAAMRELEASKIPSDLVVDFVRIRTGVFAINARIKELYDREVNEDGDIANLHRTMRYEKLRSAVVIYRQCEVTLIEMMQKMKDKYGGDDKELDKFHSVAGYLV